MRLTGTIGSRKGKCSSDPDDFFEQEKKGSRVFGSHRPSEPFISSPLSFPPSVEFPMKAIKGNTRTDVISPKFSQKSDTGALLNNVILNISQSNKKRSPRQKASSTEKPRRGVLGASVMSLNLEELNPKLKQTACKRQQRARSGSNVTNEFFIAKQINEKDREL